MNTYDFSKLVKLAKEVNNAAQSKSYFSLAMLQRAIIDHVPPIFKLKTFEMIYNNSPYPKSFTQLMKSFDQQVRKVADTFLHQHIRRKESVPTLQQVDYHIGLETLLQEIIRIESEKKRVSLSLASIKEDC